MLRFDMIVGRLEVEDLGRVGRADLELRPLTLLVGENNTGKSYLTSLLWGLLTLRWPALDVPEAWAECDALLDKHRQTSSTLVVDSNVMQKFEGALCEALKLRGGELAEILFSTSSIRPSKIQASGFGGNPGMRIEFAAPSEGVPLKVRLQSPANGASFDELRIRARKRVSDTGETLTKWALRDGPCFGLPLQVRFNLREGPPLASYYYSGDPLYLPAARTGFLILRRAVTRVLLAGGSRPELPAPLHHFLGALEALTGSQPQAESDFSREADLLEAEVKGRLVSDPQAGNTAEVRFQVEGGPLLPLAATSSLITELAPLILVLRRSEWFPWLIFEEPEAHLHPRLQRKLAQVLVRLVKKGVRVVVTSHSATFCQQINHFIRAGALSEADRTVWLMQHGYEPTDYLGQDEVVGYELRADPVGGKTSTAKLPLTEKGIGMPSFNEPLEELRRETISLMDAADGP